jgi:hypothetical protein
MFRVMIAACCVVGVVETLHAQEVCIACTEPATTYRCTFAQSDRDRRIDLDAAQIHICENVLEKTGPHRNCKLVKSDKPCDGVPRTVTVADYQKFVASDGHSTYQQGILEKAQKGVSSTWDCVASLFGDC